MSQKRTDHFIYLSHTLIDTNDSIYDKVYDIDFSNFEMTLLGGDLALKPFWDDAVLAHLDTVFNLKSPNTLWSVGNHDRTSKERFYKATLKNKFHAYQRDDITFIQLDSQDSLSAIVGEQKDFLLHTLDTLKTTSVIIMAHKLIFMNDHPVLDNMIKEVCNGHKGDCYHCHNGNNFRTAVYPKLVALQKQGIQIIWVGGDLGYRTSEFEYIDEHNITFLGNGFWYPKPWNKALLFSKRKDDRVQYTFAPIDSLIQYQNTDLSIFNFR